MKANVDTEQPSVQMRRTQDVPQPHSISTGDVDMQYMEEEKESPFGCNTESN